MAKILTYYVICLLVENGTFQPVFYFPEAVVQKCSVEKVFLEISQNSQ